jgi:hypothetical protein
MAVPMLARMDPAACNEGNRLDGSLAEDVIESLCTSHYPLLASTQKLDDLEARDLRSESLRSECFWRSEFAFVEALTATVLEGR